MLPRHALFIFTLVIGLLGFADESHAQPFFGNTTAFDPEISVVNSGALLDAQATVSADRKYVTLTVRPQLSTLIALRDFTFQGPGGVVGMTPPQQPGGDPAAGAVQPRVQPNGARPGGRGPLLPAFAREAPPTPVLLREGMIRLDE